MGIDIKEWIAEAIENQTFFDDNVKGTYDDKGKGQNLFSFLHHVNGRMTTLGGSLQCAFKYLSRACAEMDHDNPARELVLNAMDCLEVGMRGGK